MRERVRDFAERIDVVDVVPPMRTECLPWSPAARIAACGLLAAGEVVAVPTETVYGLAADATNPAAVARIYAVKGRPPDNPLIVHVGRPLASVAALEAEGLVLARAVSAAMRASADALMAAWWPGPLTLVLPRGPRLPPIVSSGLHAIGIRMPAHPAVLDLLAQLAFPLAAPSANRSNRISPTSSADVLEELGGRIPLVIDGGPCTVGVESTIVRVDETGQLQLLRPGGLPLEALEATIARPARAGPPASARLLAPGMGTTHYAPRLPLVVARRDDAPTLRARLAAVCPGAGRPRVGLLLLDGDATVPRSWELDGVADIVTYLALADPGDGSRVARGLFSALRMFDAMTLDVIVVVPPLARHTGLWPAIADRLRRASTREDVVGDRAASD
jgi:L-threonylcarbamoyladenylate synthase